MKEGDEMNIKIHSCKKHRALGYYFKLIRALIKPKQGPFKKLYYADLYCGDGECLIIETGEKYPPPLIYSLLRHADKKNFDICCFLNDNDPNKIEKIKENTKEFKEYIAEYYCEDANSVYKEILKKIPSDQFSIFYLDPTNHEQLKWSTIEGISKHFHEYNGKLRRPELIINFMVYSMLQEFKASGACKSEESKNKCINNISESIGTNKWLEKMKSNQKMKINAPIELALLETFIEQLKTLGYKIPQPIKITSTQANNPIYYIILALNDSGYSLVEKRFIPWIIQLVNKAQKENKTELKKVDAIKKGIKPLTNYGF